MGITKPQHDTYTVPERIAWRSSQDPDAEFSCLMHHINEDSLRDCYNKLDGKKAVGADGITKWDYGENLDANLKDLIDRMKRFAYRPSPVREVLIPKEGKKGATRPLGICIFEDKLVQKRMQELLDAIYDPIFIDHSYGFRPNRGCHDAIEAVHRHLYRNAVEAVIDVDLANYFGTIDHKLLVEMLQKKIKDPIFIRYIGRMFKAGVLADGEFRRTPEGVPQGSCVSPVLSNVFAHYVIDTWFTEVVQVQCKGKVELIRYADDLVILCQYDSDAHKIKTALSKRLTEYKLKLNEAKTKVVRFSQKEYARGVKQETFNILGFTFYIGQSRRGVAIPKLKTDSKRLRSKLKKFNRWMKENRNKYRLIEIWKRIYAAVRGHINYYGVSFNTRNLQNFIWRVERIAFKWLNRRSQKKSFNWEQFKLFLKSNPLPAARISHKLF